MHEGPQTSRQGLQPIDSIQPIISGCLTHEPTPHPIWSTVNQYPKLS